MIKTCTWSDLIMNALPSRWSSIVDQQWPVGGYFVSYELYLLTDGGYKSVWWCMDTSAHHTNSDLLSYVIEDGATEDLHKWDDGLVTAMTAVRIQDT